MDLVRYIDSGNDLCFLDLDEIDEAYIKTYADPRIGKTLCYTLKGQGEHHEVSDQTAARITQALVLKSRILPNARTEAES